MKSGKVLSVGRVYSDLVFSNFPHMPVLGEEVYADSFGVHAGGGAYITAAHLMAVGQDTALCAVLPAAPFGAFIQDEISAARIDTRPSIIASPEWGHQATIAMAHDGDRAFLTKRGGSAVPPNCKGEILSGQYRHLHIAELATLVECPSLLDWAKQAGLTISLDCSWDVDAMHHPNAISLISKVDLFLPNLAELKFVMRSEEIDPMRLLQTFGATCLVALKKGAQGAALFNGGLQTQAAAIKCDPIDTTGAGDAFNAGFIAAWLKGDEHLDCLNAGNLRASICVASLGGAALQASSEHAARPNLKAVKA